MSKTPEQYVEYALKHFSEHHKTAGRIVQELRAAGWLREANEIPALVALEGYKRLLAEKERELCPGCYDRVTELTRERDEARTNAAQAVGQLDLAQRERDEARVDREAWARAYRRALASAASPEVMRVTNASLAEWERVKRDGYTRDGHGDNDAWTEWWDANAALSASRQPKAQEPRYEARGHEVWDTLGRGPIKARKVAAFSCMDDVEGAAREFAARLNGEGGGK